MFNPRRFHHINIGRSAEKEDWKRDEAARDKPEEFMPTIIQTDFHTEILQHYMVQEGRRILAEKGLEERCPLLTIIQTEVHTGI